MVINNKNNNTWFVRNIYILITDGLDIYIHGTTLVIWSENTLASNKEIQPNLQASALEVSAHWANSSKQREVQPETIAYCPRVTWLYHNKYLHKYIVAKIKQ